MGHIVLCWNVCSGMVHRKREERCVVQDLAMFRYRLLPRDTGVYRQHRSLPWVDFGSVSCRGIQGKCRERLVQVEWMVSEADLARRLQLCNMK